MKQKKYETQKNPFAYIVEVNNQYALNQALGRIRQKYGWTERQGLDELSILHANLVHQDRFAGIFFPDWNHMTDADGRTIRKQLHDPMTKLRSWDLLLNECLVAQSEDAIYAKHVANWRAQYLRTDKEES